MSMFKKEFAFDIYAYLGFIIFYFIAYRDVLFEQFSFWALNLAPLPTSNSRFYIPGQFYWFPGNLGSLLAPASVKYIILANPDPNTLWNETPALGAPLHSASDLSGPLGYANERVQGNPLDISRILDEQSDLKLVHVDKDFRAYENIMYSPKILRFITQPT